MSTGVITLSLDCVCLLCLQLVIGQLLSPALFPFVFRFCSGELYSSLPLSKICRGYLNYYWYCFTGLFSSIWLLLMYSIVNRKLGTSLTTQRADVERRDLLFRRLRLGRYACLLTTGAARLPIWGRLVLEGEPSR